MMGEAGLMALQYQRDAIANGEAWRLFTAHFVHLNTPHLAGNLLGLEVLWVLLSPALSMSTGVLIVLGAMIGCDLGLWFLHPELAWYTGLSGVLHGLLLAGALALAREQRLVGFGLAALTLFKLLWEQFVGPLPGSETLIRHRVIVDAHLYGAVGGVAALLLRELVMPGRARRARDTQRTS